MSCNYPIATAQCKEGRDLGYQEDRGKRIAAMTSKQDKKTYYFLKDGSRQLTIK